MFVSMRQHFLDYHFGYFTRKSVIFLNPHHQPPCSTQPLVIPDWSCNEFLPSFFLLLSLFLSLHMLLRDLGTFQTWRKRGRDKMGEEKMARWRESRKSDTSRMRYKVEGEGEETCVTCVSCTFTYLQTHRWCLSPIIIRINHRAHNNIKQGTPVVFNASSHGKWFYLLRKKVMMNTQKRKSISIHPPFSQKLSINNYV